MSSRRLMYLHTILKRSDNELTISIYNSQKKNPSDGDWCMLVKIYKEKEKFGLNEKGLEEESKSAYSTKFKDKINEYTFSALLKENKEHSKVESICYKRFKTQSYLKIHLVNSHEVYLLFSLR